ncbi:hypothetical protein M0805_008839 [Coniferiporia weirii]|nr:hypothetical protein M0805_008839 [Coniferiporia weirii]
MTTVASFSQYVRQLGTLSRLVDDILQRILCFCDTIDLLHVEQTCKYLRLIVTDREIWLAVLHRLPRESAPSTTPYQKREEADFRELAVKAVRGYRNWTSEHPKPLRHCRLNVLQPKEMRRDLRLLPGGRYIMYFLNRTKSLHCFDIIRNAYVLERELHDVNFHSSVYNMNSDGTCITVFIVSMGIPRAGPLRTAIVDFFNIDLKLGKDEPSHRISLEWSDLNKVAKAAFIRLYESSADRDALFVSFVAEDLSSQVIKKGGILIDAAKSLILLLLLKPNGSYDGVSHMRIANDSLFYMSGGMKGNPTIHAVPFSQFDRYQRKISEPTAWINYEIANAHDTRISLADFWTAAPARMQVMIHPPTWLDLEKAGAANPTVASLLLINVRLASGGLVSGGSFNSERLAKSFYLRFSENKASPSGESSGQFTLESEPAPIFHDMSLSGGLVSELYPSRHGRMVAHVWENATFREPSTKAVTLLPFDIASTS